MAQLLRELARAHMRDPATRQTLVDSLKPIMAPVLIEAAREVATTYRIGDLTLNPRKRAAYRAGQRILHIKPALWDVVTFVLDSLHRQISDAEYRAFRELGTKQEPLSSSPLKTAIGKLKDLLPEFKLHAQGRGLWALDAPLEIPAGQAAVLPTDRQKP